jgi:hypothetical protein
MQSLRSITITVTSSLLQTAPPLCLVSVLSFSQGLYLNFSLCIEATGSHVLYRSLNQSHATFMPDATQAVSRFPLGLSWRTDSHQFWRRPIIFDTSSVVRLRSPLWFTTDPVQRDLFLNAHHNGSLPMQLEVFWSLLLQADSEGPTHPHLLCSLVAHYLQ